MVTKNQILYLLNELLLHDSDVKVKDEDIAIESQIIYFKINNYEFKETIFNFYDIVLDEKDHKFLDDIKDKINNCDANINSLRSVLNQINIQQVNWLKITTFFINEAYLNKDIAYDIHHRVSSNEITTKYITYLEFPIVDIISTLFCDKLKIKKNNNFKINFTCDFDILNNWTHIGQYGFFKRILRHFFRLQFITLVKEIISLKLADKELKWNFYLNDKMFLYPLKYPLRNLEAQNIAFMLMSKDNQQYDVNNNFETNAFKTFLTEVKKKFNITIGIHPNYDTTKKPDLLTLQIEKFKNIFGFLPDISRFHYLKCNFPDDLTILETNNIKYDYSFGFANSLLFRGGRTFPLKLWDQSKNKMQDVVSVPLSIMDTTLNDYLYLTYEEALEACKKKILYSIAFGSSLTLLWHNHNMYQHHRIFNYHNELFTAIKKFLLKLDLEISQFKKNKKSICVILDWPIVNDARVIRLIRAFSSRVLVDLYYMGGTIIDKDLFNTNVVRLINIPKKNNSYWKFITHTFFTYQYYYYLKEILDNNIQYDHIYVNDLPLLKVGVELKRKFCGILFYDSHEIYVETLNQQYPVSQQLHKKLIFNFLVYFKKIIGKITERKYLKYVDYFITVNDSLAKYFKHLYGFPNIITLMNCPNYSDEIINPAINYREKYNWTKNDKIFVYQGLLNLGRGIDIIIKAISISNEHSKLIIMGEGMLKKDIIILVEKLHLQNRVKICDSVPYTILLEYTSAADFGIYLIEDFNLSKKLASPNKLFEFIYVGLPVITTRSLESLKVYEKFNIGKLVENDVEQVSMAINDFISSDNIKSYKSNCLRAKEYYNFEKTSEYFFNQYDKILEK